MLTKNCILTIIFILSSNLIAQNVISIENDNIQINGEYGLINMYFRIQRIIENKSVDIGIVQMLRVKNNITYTKKIVDLQDYKIRMGDFIENEAWQSVRAFEDKQNISNLLASMNIHSTSFGNSDYDDSIVSKEAAETQVTFNEGKLPPPSSKKLINPPETVNPPQPPIVKPPANKQNLSLNKDNSFILGYAYAGNLGNFIGEYDSYVNNWYNKNKVLGGNIYSEKSSPNGIYFQYYNYQYPPISNKLSLGFEFSLLVAKSNLKIIGTYNKNNYNFNAEGILNNSLIQLSGGLFLYTIKDKYKWLFGSNINSSSFNFNMNYTGDFEFLNSLLPDENSKASFFGLDAFLGFEYQIYKQYILNTEIKYVYNFKAIKTAYGDCSFSGVQVYIGLGYQF